MPQWSTEQLQEQPLLSPESSVGRVGGVDMSQLGVDVSQLESQVVCDMPQRSLLSAFDEVVQQTSHSLPTASLGPSGTVVLRDQELGVGSVDWAGDCGNGLPHQMGGGDDDYADSQSGADSQAGGDRRHHETEGSVQAHGTPVNSEAIGNACSLNKKWEGISTAVCAAGFIRNGYDCENRWKNLWKWYRKVLVHDGMSGVQSYWTMSPEARANAELTFRLRRSWFDLIDSFNIRNPVVHPEGVVDPGNEKDGRGPGQGSRGSTPVSGGRAESGVANACAEGAEVGTSAKRRRTLANARERAVKDISAVMREQTDALREHSRRSVECAELTVKAMYKQAAVQQQIGKLTAKVAREDMAIRKEIGVAEIAV
ncbi:hypothetical protein CBR_g23866 [Chara braunii]|uniref:Myb-like domain-containing protein n=1 Tax=Chara braunii TaxID=69332 RepID=A0A388L540_CHABU|nr:hypothetical protein CBR_g23866 [Chara braunii]|eukprot:GBG77417.1 hypothetical protein CBR_g23866 [Chara braunii]